MALSCKQYADNEVIGFRCRVIGFDVKMPLKCRTFAKVIHTSAQGNTGQSSATSEHLHHKNNGATCKPCIPPGGLCRLSLWS